MGKSLEFPTNITARQFLFMAKSEWLGPPDDCNTTSQSIAIVCIIHMLSHLHTCTLCKESGDVKIRFLYLLIWKLF